VRRLCKAGTFLHWLEVTPLADCGAVFVKVLDRLASGCACVSRRRKRHRAQNIADALRDADGAPREGKPLLDLAAGLQTKGSCRNRFDGIHARM